MSSAEFVPSQVLASGSTRPKVVGRRHNALDSADVQSDPAVARRLRGLYENGWRAAVRVGG